MLDGLRGEHSIAELTRAPTLCGFSFRHPYPQGKPKDPPSASLPKQLEITFDLSYECRRHIGRFRRADFLLGYRTAIGTASVSFEQGNVIGLLLKSTYFFSRVLSGAIS